MKIREATLSDVPKINKLIINSIDFFHSENYTQEQLIIWRRGYSVSNLEKQIQSRKSILIEVEEEIAGFVQFDPPEVKGFYINPKFSGQGLASTLLEHLLSELEEEGQKEVELTSNQLVVTFYKKFGFEVLHEEIVYWENTPFVEYRMIRKLFVTKG